MYDSQPKTDVTVVIVVTIEGKVAAAGCSGDPDHGPQKDGGSTSLYRSRSYLKI